MKKKPCKHLEQHRIKDAGPRSSDARYGNNGAFAIPYNGSALVALASDGEGWDHVSVRVDLSSGLQRIPTWEEMCYVKSLFFKRDETVVQYHPTESSYVNNHPCVLHLWRPQDVEVPMPPMAFV